uniref:ZP domain-containing protein n=1 Tax=Panagrolaimus sp. PS1159 TaxID=55785 RepID=A0AC35F977_9BILA
YLCIIFRSSVCYKSLDGWGNSIRAGSCSDSTSCELKVYDDGAGIYFGKARVPETDITGCLQTSMRYPSADVKENAKHLGIFESCTPKVVDDNVIELYISIDPSCSIIVKNAKVHVPITPQSTNLATNLPPKHSPEHPSEASFP